MSYIGKNPKFNSTVFTDIGNGAVDNPASGSHRLVNRNGGLVLRDSTGVEISAGGGSTAIKITQTAHGYVVGDVLYFDGANYLKAIASAANTSEVVGVVSKIINANSFELTTAGQVTDLAGLTAGTVYFLSPTVAGAWTDTEPSTLGQISSPLGVASDTTKLIVAIKRGIVVGGTNARAVVSLANNATTTIQNVSTYDAGEVTGWVSIAATTPLKFYVSAPFAKNGAGTDYNISPSYLGDTPPVGFSVTVTSGGLIQATLPSVAGFTAASINYALNAPAVGATFPLSVDAGTITTGTVAAARLPQVSSSSQGAFPSLTSSLDNATATQLGLKQYLHGTTYNGGNAPTVTCSTPGFVVLRATFLPYQIQDGSWRLRFNIYGTGTNANISSTSITTAGVVYKTGTQVVSSVLLGATYNPSYSYAAGTTSNIQIGTAAVSNNIGEIGVSGDVELESKPTWAY